MKNFNAFLLVFYFLSLTAHAQFTDDMDYPGPIPPSSYWWDCSVGCPITGAGAGALYGIDPSTNNTYLDLGGKTDSRWELSFVMYVPSGKEAYFNFQGVLPVTGGEWVVGNIFFNRDLFSPGLGSIVGSSLGDVMFDFPHDEWFSIAIYFDFSEGMENGKWFMEIAGTLVVPEGTSFTNQFGTIPTSLAAVDFVSELTTLNYLVDPANVEYFIDDIVFAEDEIILSTNDLNYANFSILPNPVPEELVIKSENKVIDSRIYSMQGSLVLQGASENNINVSRLSPGLYFIEVTTTSGKSVQKFVKI